MPKELTAAFLDALDTGGRAAWDPATLEPRLQQVLAEARAAWPDCALEPAALVAHLAGCVVRSDDARAALDSVRAADVLLAWASARGDAAAVAAFEEQVMPAVDPALARLDLSAAAVDETKQAMRQHLLVGDGRPPALLSYAGRGPLRAWVKVAATRMALKALQRGKKEIPVEERVLGAMPLEAEDPELQYLKEHYRDAFKAAVRQAIAALDARQTNLICQHYLDGLTTHQLGALYRVNQSTAARWLERARQAILDNTRRGLMERLQVDRGEYESIMRLLHSHLDVTLRSFLVNLKR